MMISRDGNKVLQEGEGEDWDKKKPTSRAGKDCLVEVQDGLDKRMMTSRGGKVLLAEGGEDQDKRKSRDGKDLLEEVVEGQGIRKTRDGKALLAEVEECQVKRTRASRTGKDQDGKEVHQAMKLKKNKHGNPEAGVEETVADKQVQEEVEVCKDRMIGRLLAWGRVKVGRKHMVTSGKEIDNMADTMHIRMLHLLVKMR